MTDLNSNVRAMYLIALMLQIAWIVMLAYFLHYFVQLKQSECTCALSWRTTLLRALLAGMIVILVLNLFLRGSYMNILSILQFAVVVTFIVVAFQFSRSVRRDGCYCAQTTAFRVLDIVNMVMLIVLSLSIIVQVARLVLVYMFSKSARRSASAAAATSGRGKGRGSK